MPNAQLVKTLLMISPFGATLQQVRHALIDPSHPSVVAVVGSRGIVATSLS